MLLWRCERGSDRVSRRGCRSSQLTLRPFYASLISHDYPANYHFYQQRDERVLIVWSDSIDTIIPTCHDFEERLIKLLWRSRPNAHHAPASSSSHPGSTTGMQ